MGVRRRLLIVFHDVFGRADMIGVGTDIEIAFRMRNDDAARGRLRQRWMCDSWNIWRHRAVALPEQDLRLPDLLGAQAAGFEIGIPDHHLVHCDAELVAGPATEVLVGEEQNLFALREGPLAMVPAFDEVHTIPPRSPQKAFRSAAELM